MDAIVRLFEHYAEQLPLELFVLTGSFLEEIISPIPSFVVLIPAGAAAQVQGVGWWYLLPLALIAGVGRILASMILYLVADKAEDWLFGKGRRLFGVTHQKLESYGERFSGKRRDFFVLFLLNAVPVLPTSLLSLTCGFIKIRFSFFVWATYFGSAVNAVCYMSIGYAGIQIASGLRHFELASQIAAITVVASLLGWFIYLRFKKRRTKP